MFHSKKHIIRQTKYSIRQNINFHYSSLLQTDTHSPVCNDLATDTQNNCYITDCKRNLKKSKATNCKPTIRKTIYTYIVDQITLFVVFSGIK